RRDVEARREASSWLIWTAVILQIAALAWGAYIAGALDSGAWCSRPLRGIVAACCGMLGVSVAMLLLTHWNVQTTFRKFTQRAATTLSEEMEDEDDPLAHEKAKLTHQQTEMLVS